MTNQLRATGLMAITLATQCSLVKAVETTDIQFQGVASGVAQHMALDGSAYGEDKSAGGFTIQPEITFNTSERDSFYMKFGFAAGNGLNGDSPFSVPTWAADLEDDVTLINGRNRDYLLSAWYKHSFQPASEHSLDITGGIIDATDFLDQNVYSNDEFTQFLNGALVNGPNLFAPSYDIGAAVEWGINAFSLSAVLMSVGENEDGNSYTYGGAQLGYALESQIGVGNYRAILFSTSNDFLDPSGQSEQQRQGIIFSFDQTIGEHFGVFTRFGWQDDKAAIDNKGIFSGGGDLSGKLWRRANDNIGIGFAYVDGGNLDIHHSRVYEFYYRYVFNDTVSLTADLQYINESLKSTAGPKAFIPGLRVVAEY
ncbi:carbohydrate porin [Kaarinaea lacus]